MDGVFDDETRHDCGLNGATISKLMQPAELLDGQLLLEADAGKEVVGDILERSRIILLDQLLEDVGVVLPRGTVEELVEVGEAGEQDFLAVEEPVVEVGYSLRVHVADAQGDVDDVVVEVLPDLLHVGVLFLEGGVEALLVEGAHVTVLLVKVGIRWIAIVVVEEELVVPHVQVVDDELPQVLVVAHQFKGQFYRQVVFGGLSLHEGGEGDGNTFVSCENHNDFVLNAPQIQRGHFGIVKPILFRHCCEETINFIRHFVVSKGVVPRQRKALCEGVFLQRRHRFSHFSVAAEVFHIGKVDPFGLSTVKADLSVVFVPIADFLHTLRITVNESHLRHSLPYPKVRQGRVEEFETLRSSHFLWLQLIRRTPRVGFEWTGQEIVAGCDKHQDESDLEEFALLLWIQNVICCILSRLSQRQVLSANLELYQLYLLARSLLNAHAAL